MESNVTFNNLQITFSRELPSHLRKYKVKIENCTLIIAAPKGVA